ncbi:protein RETARDED ROOT GROWTH, mitochondrial isoform X1 [Cornus florida]|uniref:protein RETARDED ROOT GROWTH, mitochondrial isoform X1 n=2 Tax=Cornus florida TaxID=4283 RepID=UPI002898738D|nr:protein RETARDED ROOT GROWTH, mitochondrial isoform X1 [Cornus florida]XP_059655766.1 protein RETARDED ROOT GROWTH, mitochondrial isoform X1 [Cornus florida]XP_059655767.1 protein RETARDED ROOT GROWTH, mitochondrial isoform X1 [Cornus florida]
MGRWVSSLILSYIARIPKSLACRNPSHSPILSRPLTPLHHLLPSSKPRFQFLGSRVFSAIPSPYINYGNEIDSENYGEDYVSESDEDEDTGKIPIKAFFLCTSIDLKSMQAENSSNVIPPTSRSTNYIALRFRNFPSEATGIGVEENVNYWRYMVVSQYGSAVLFNMEDDEVESYLEIIRRHASGFLPEIKKDDYAVKEKPMLVEDMQGGPDYIVLKHLDTDSIRIIGCVLGQSIALDYFVSQVDGMVEEFTYINRGMEKTGTFTMNRKKLFQLVGKANSNLADVILKVGLFERSEIAWRDAKYAQIFEYLREEYEITQRFGNLDFKLKFVEHNIHFLQEVLQNRKSDLLEWCIIFLLSIENVISICEIIRDTTTAAPL